MWRYKLTLWWRTLLYGPMCQRCESRHGTTRGVDFSMCYVRQRIAEAETEHLRFLRKWADR